MTHPFCPYILFRCMGLLLIAGLRGPGFAQTPRPSLVVVQHGFTFRLEGSE
jgi:hypothetical protein